LGGGKTWYGEWRALGLQGGGERLWGIHGRKKETQEWGRTSLSDTRVQKERSEWGTGKGDGKLKGGEEDTYESEWSR